MGKFAQVVGVGVKGGVHLELASSSAVAGDVAQGAIFIHVKEEIYAKGGALLLL